MRIFLAATVFLLLAPSLVSAGSREPADTLPVSVLRIEGKGVYVTWAPARGAVTYEVYRGPTLDDLTLLATTPNLQYSDFAPLNDDAWYVVQSQVPESVPSVLGEPARGKCLAIRGASSVALTLAHCMPGRLP